MSDFTLDGLDGANPLAFLAALGTLRTAAAVWGTAKVRMSWVQSSGGWRPRLVVAAASDGDALIKALHLQLQDMKDHPALLSATISRFRHSFFATR